MDGRSSSAPTAIECGGTFEPPRPGEPTLTGHFPAAVSTTEQVLSGSVELAAVNQIVDAVVIPGADLFLVRHGRVVTLPQPQDLVGRRLVLAPGEHTTLPAHATLAACESAATTALPSGEYALYARIMLNHDDGSWTAVIGGPWPLELHQGPQPGEDPPDRR